MLGLYLEELVFHHGLARFLSQECRRFGRPSRAGNGHMSP